jgi:RNA polymerase sigma factor (TIGR02999 family)
MSSGSHVTFPTGEITQLLKQLSAGNRVAERKLVPLIYENLRGITARHIAAERPDHTLQPTALVHEPHLKLVQQRGVSWRSRAHFFRIAAPLMRHILVDHTRQAKAAKRQVGEEFSSKHGLVYSEERPVSCWRSKKRSGDLLSGISAKAGW